MKIKQELREKIVDAISDVGSDGATINQLKDRVGLERHTLAKYLYLLHRDGVLHYRSVGRAKLWFVQNNPIKHMFDKQSKSFSERFLIKLMSHMPMGVIVTDENKEIIFANEYIALSYESAEGKKLSDVLPLHNLSKYIAQLNNGSSTVEFTAKDNEGHTLYIKGSYVKNPTDSMSYIWVVMNLEDEIESKIKGLTH